MLPEEVWECCRDQELLMLWALVNEINASLLWNEADLNKYIGVTDMFVHV